jgi:hypothetical protein
MDFSYRDDSTDWVFTLILEDFHQSDFHRSGLKSLVFGSPQQLLVARINKKSETNRPYVNEQKSLPIGSQNQQKNPKQIVFIGMGSTHINIIYHLVTLYYHETYG